MTTGFVMVPERAAYWLRHATELALYAGIKALPVRVMVNRNAPEPVIAKNESKIGWP